MWIAKYLGTEVTVKKSLPDELKRIKKELRLHHILRLEGAFCNNPSRNGRLRIPADLLRPEARGFF
jgi:hypothetical protein